MNTGNITTIIKGDSITFKISGDLDYSLRASFLKAIDDINDNIKMCNVDLSEANHIDSSGLGMLLILKSHPQFKDNEIKINVTNNKTITEIIFSHNFNQLFHIIS